MVWPAEEQSDVGIFFFSQPYFSRLRRAALFILLDMVGVFFSSLHAVGGWEQWVSLFITRDYAGKRRSELGMFKFATFLR